MAILAFDAREMGWPDMASIPCALKVRHHGLKGTVKRVGVDADDLDSLFDQPKNSFASQAGLSKVILTAQSLVSVGSEEHDVERLQSMSNGFELLLEMFNGDRIASGNVANERLVLAKELAAPIALR